MSVNSLESLLNRMKGGSVALGWGAIAAFGRAQLNRLLEEQYLTWLSDSRFVPPISGEIILADGAESIKLEDLFLGKPVLSFATASLNHSLVTLTMNIVGGSYTAMSHPVNSAPKLMSSFSIAEEMGYKIELQVNLNQIEGEVDKRGRVTLDLASDPAMKCNLGGLPAVQTKIAALIQTRLAGLPGDARTFELGLFDFSGYNPLSPKGFYLRTQRAPGADNPLSPNYGDGAVLVFMRLKVKDENGQGLPSEGSGFPYLIPDDQSAGKELYSASLVLNHENLGLLEETQLDVLKNLLFPGENIFVESTNGRHTPFDLLVLGNVKTSDESVAITPSFISLKGGKAQQFTARKGNGSTVNAQWSVNNPINPLSKGTITETGGMYMAPVTSKMGKERQPIVVSAQYSASGRQQTRLAMVLGVFESMSVSPRVSVSGVGSSASSIPLTVTSMAGAELVWPKLDPQEGTLTVIDNNHAVYEPPSNLAVPLAVQKINVSEKQTNEMIEATIVLVAGPHNLVVQPPYVAAATASSPVQLSTELPPDVLVWEVIGEGSVDEFGLFTPPATPTSRFSVVRCSYSVAGIPLASGFSVIQLTEQQEAIPHWSSLQEFSIKVIGGRDTAFANGCQQIPVLITIETNSTTVGGQEYDIPASDAELATLKLVDKSTNAEVPFVHVAQEGIEYGSGIQFAANKKRNRFRFFSRTGMADASLEAPAAPKNNRIRTRELYIQLAVGGSRTFYARFQGAGNRTFNSTDSKEENYEVTVHSETFLPPDPDPDPNKNPYKFNRDRVAQDPDGYDMPPSSHNPETDYFSMYRWSTDYWRLTYSAQGGRTVPFVTSSIEANISSIQWESELLDEVFFSYTGCAFNPANFEGSDSPSPEGLSFDPFFWGLTRQQGIKLTSSFAPDKEPASGEFVISLHRVDNMPYWYDGMANGDERKLFRKHLEPGIKFSLLDMDGNRHALQASFETADKEDSRNKLVLRRQ